MDDPSATPFLLRNESVYPGDSFFPAINNTDGPVSPATKPVLYTVIKIREFCVFFS